MDTENVTMSPLSPMSKPIDVQCNEGFCKCNYNPMNAHPQGSLYAGFVYRYSRDCIVNFYMKHNDANKISLLDHALAIYDDRKNSIVRNFNKYMISYAAAAFRSCCNSSRFTSTLVGLVGPKAAVDIGYLYFCTIYLRLHCLYDMNEKWIMMLAYLYARVKNDFSLEDVFQKFKIYYEKNKPYLQHRFYKHDSEDHVNIIGDYDKFVKDSLEEFRVELLARQMWDTWEMNTAEEIDCPVAYAQWLPREMVEDVVSIMV